MAPPRLNTPWVVRSIRFYPDDITALEAVRRRLGETDGSATIRRLIREADAGVSATVVAKAPVKAVQRAEKPVSVGVPFGRPDAKPGSRAKKK